MYEEKEPYPLWVGVIEGLVLSPPPKDLVGYDLDKPADSDIRKQLPKTDDDNDQKGKEDDFNEHGKSFL